MPTPASGPLLRSPAGPASPEAPLRLPSIEPFANGEPGVDAAKQTPAGRRRQARTGLRPALQVHSLLCPGPLSQIALLSEAHQSCRRWP